MWNFHPIRRTERENKEEASPEPRGPTRAPTWRGGDTWHAYLYLLVILGL